MKSKPNIVVIGGGTGTSVVLSGLKKYPVNLSAIVSVADSGGSTGKLRDEFGFMPVGDLRQSLSALADPTDQGWIKKVLLYRFSHGQGLEGHNLGNLILTALQDMTGSTAQAIEIAEKIFNLEGSIYPVTDQTVDLVIEYDDGRVVIGEHHLNPENSGGKKIKRVKLSPHASLYAKSKQAIVSADLIIIGPGDLYASILPNLVVSGFKAAIRQSKARIAYVVNLMTGYTQTHNYTATDHVAEIEKYLGRKPDVVIVNNGKIPHKIANHYETEAESAVINDLDPSKYSVIADDLVSIAKTTQTPGDPLKRSLLRHHQAKLTKILLSLSQVSHP